MRPFPLELTSMLGGTSASSFAPFSANSWEVGHDNYPLHVLISSCRAVTRLYYGMSMNHVRSCFGRIYHIVRCKPL
jgi:hypothetical protein